jgi:hypothetical protein
MATTYKTKKVTLQGMGEVEISKTSQGTFEMVARQQLVMTAPDGTRFKGWFHRPVYFSVTNNIVNVFARFPYAEDIEKALQSALICR